MKFPQMIATTMMATLLVCLQTMSTNTAYAANLHSDKDSLHKTPVSQGKQLTTEQGIALLQEKAKLDPEFLDRQHGTGKPNTFRMILNGLIRQHAESLQSVAALKETDPVPPQIQEFSTVLGSARVYETIMVGASMNVYYTGPGPVTATQTITTTGIGPNIVFPYNKPASTSFPWIVVGSMQFSQPGTIMATTVHAVATPSGNANASSSDNGTVSP